MSKAKELMLKIRETIESDTLTSTEKLDRIVEIASPISRVQNKLYDYSERIAIEFAKYLLFPAEDSVYWLREIVRNFLNPLIGLKVRHTNKPFDVEELKTALSDQCESDDEAKRIIRIAINEKKEFKAQKEISASYYLESWKNLIKVIMNHFSHDVEEINVEKFIEDVKVNLEQGNKHV